jgi:hypothetical protein
MRPSVADLADVEMGVQGDAAAVAATRDDVAERLALGRAE